MEGFSHDAVIEWRNSHIAYVWLTYEQRVRIAEAAHDELQRHLRSIREAEAEPIACENQG
jgi:hypothetical protein